MISDWSWTLNNKKYPIWYLPPETQISIPFPPTSCFQDTRLLKIVNIRNAPNDIRPWTLNNNKRPGRLDALLGHLLDKRIPVRYKLSSTKIAENLSQSRHKVIKMEMHHMTPNWPWTLNSDKYSVCTKDLPLSADILVYFAVWTLVFKIQGPQKSELHWMTPTEIWTLNSQKYPIYTKYLPQTLKFWSVLLYD